MKELTVKIKLFSRKYLKEHGDIVFRDRELIVEKEEGDTPENTVLRFKMGDGVHPYSVLGYVSSIYTLYPNFKLYDKQYTSCINLTLCNEE